ncbi:hypothetical protein CTA1_3133 [Colletotrichum tanaceti]|uniref:Uncharacterized protein n=1 Tax=Colletotrichum tanaceti TaxID=1306861 RepID=A0A4U6XVT1_9PEZI|nr:hypothetical protein CTA1_3133 [Colletotrichum tanaceti]
MRSAALVSLSEAEARKVHTAAVNTPIIDGRKSASIKRNDMRLIAQRLGLNQGTVYSPAAYFVDLVQYLKASMVPVDMDDSKTKGTALDLTRENTEAPVPYLDLVNEIMESFIVQFDAFIMDDIMEPRRSPISAYNVNKNDASDLL